MSQQLIVMCGVPASGKSTVSKKLADKLEATLISRDQVRNQIKETKYTPEAHERVRNAFFDKIKGKLMNGESVVADATHLTRLSRERILEIGKQFKTATVAVYFDVEWETLKSRNALRDAKTKVPEDALRSMYLDYSFPSKTEGFTNIVKIKDNGEIINE